MSVADLWERIRVSCAQWFNIWPARYGFAVLAVALATGLQFVLQWLGPFHLAFILYYPAVVLVAMWAGFWPGIVVTVLSAAAGGYFFLEPRNTFAVHNFEDVVGPTLFALIGVALTFLVHSRDRAKQALRVSDAELNRAQAVAHIGSWHYDFEQTSLRLSEEACRIVGLPANVSLSVEQAQNMIEAQDRERLLRAWEAFLAGGPYDEPSRVLIEGRTRWVRIQGSLERDAAGRPAKALGTVQDITDHKAAQERVEEFERAVEGLEEMIVVVDRDYRYVIANHAYLKHREMKKEDVIGHLASEIVEPEIFENSVRGHLEKCFRGETVQFDLHYAYPTLGERDLVASYYPIAGPEGVDRVVSVLQDVTEKKRTGQALRASEDRYRDLVENSEDLVCTHNLEGRLLSVNPAPARILGYEVEELLKIPMRELIIPEGREEFDAYLERLRTTGQPEHGLLCVMAKNGEVRTWEYHNTLRTEGVATPVVRGMAHDVTEKRRAELALVASEQKFSKVFRQSPMSITLKRARDHRYIEVNETFERMTGWSRDEVIGRTPLDIGLWVDPAQRLDVAQQVLTNGPLGDVETRFRTKDGSMRTASLTMEAIELNGDTCVIVIGADITERKEAEEAQRSSEQRYRVLFEKNIAGVAIASLDGKVLDCNDAWARILGYESAAEIRGRQTAEFYFDLTDEAPLLNELEQTGALLSREMQMRRKDGTGVWVLFNCNVRRGAYGEEPFIQTTAIDITERKQAEGELRSSEQRYRTLFEESIAGVVMIRLDGKVIDCNDAFAHQFGYRDAEEGRGCNVTDHYPDPAYREVVLDELKRDGIYFNRELELRRKDGTPIWVLLNCLLLTEGRSEPLIQSTVFDITKRKRAEESLRNAKEFSDNLIQTANVIILSLDPEGNVTLLNDAGEEITGYTGAELKGKSWTNLVPKDRFPHVWEEFKRVLDGTAGETFENPIVTKTGEERYIAWRNNALRLNGKVVGTISFGNDVTERKRAEEAIRQSEERFRIALKDSPITVFSQDRDLCYTWIYNPQLYWQHDTVGKTDEQILGAKKVARLVEIKRRVLETGKAVREEIAIPHDNKNYSFDITIEPLFDADKSVIGITGVAVDIARLRELADRLEETKEKLTRAKSYLENEIETELGFETIIGQSPALREVQKNARVVAPTDSTVLLLGETGTGKELIARSVHALSSRREQNFIKLNCAAVPSGLLESELFGHEKGAFTGAVGQKVGRIELADKGTLFLDEIGELPLELQPKLLRVLQDREFERLGGVRTLKVDVRIISATNRDLQKDVAAKKFREDLFYRLNVFPIQLPALRERRSDIPLLVQHFVRKHALRMGKHIEIIPNETMDVLQKWNWPGNIRELENMIERMVILTKTQELAPPPEELRSPLEIADDDLTEMEREHIIRVLRETSGVLSGPDGAANRLGIKRTTLQSMLKRLGIEPHEFRHGTGTFGPE